MISKELDKSQQVVSSKVDTMVNRIVKQHLEERYDNIRLNHIRGRYKRCIKCGEVKLDIHFYKGKNVCKPCHIKQQSTS